MSQPKRDELLLLRSKVGSQSSSRTLRKVPQLQPSTTTGLRLMTPQHSREGSFHSIGLAQDNAPLTSRESHLYKADQYIQLAPSNAIIKYISNTNTSSNKTSNNNSNNTSARNSISSRAQFNSNISMPPSIINSAQSFASISPSMLFQQSRPNTQQNMSRKQAGSTQQLKSSSVPHHSLSISINNNNGNPTTPLNYPNNYNYNSLANLNDHDNIHYQDDDNNNIDPTDELKGILQGLIAREEELVRVLTQRANKLADIVKLFGTEQNQNSLNLCINCQIGGESDLVKLKEGVSELSECLSVAAKNETELGAKIRQVESLVIEKRKVRMNEKRVIERNKDLQKQIDKLEERIKGLMDDNTKLSILLNTEKKQSRVSARKILALESRVEFILENDVNTLLNPNDKLRQSLNELLRENESLKRDLTHKNQEIERSSGNMKRTTDIINRLNAKINSFKKQPVNDSLKKINTFSSNSGNQITSSQQSSYQQQLQQLYSTDLIHSSDQQTQQLIDMTSSGFAVNNNSEFLLPTAQKLRKNDDIDLFSNFIIPANLAFRIVSLKADHQNVISDLIDSGSLSFTKRIMAGNTQINHQKDVLNLISNQFLSFKELSEKVNLMFSGIYGLFEDVELSTVIPDFNVLLAKVFYASTAHIWVVDSINGILVTWENGREKRCMVSKGLVCECFFSRKPLNSKNARNKPLMYLIGAEKEEPVVVDTCLLLPIVENTTKQVKFVVEVSNSRNDLFSFDEEYLSILLAHYLTAILTDKYKIRMLQQVVKFNSQMIEEFNGLLYSKTKRDFTKSVQEAYSRCFGISNFLFYFVENDQLAKHHQNGETSYYSLQYGLVGQAVRDLKSYIITDINHSSYYNQIVDIKSILPVQAIPLIDISYSNDIEHNRIKTCLGVIEIGLKQKYRSDQADMLIDGFTGYFGLEESLSTKIQEFSNMVAHAIRILENNVFQKGNNNNNNSNPNNQ